jgi:hypothetical protein
VTINLPRYDKRTTVIGSTGSGKTQFSVWLLSIRDFDLRPWVVFDFKGDELIEQIGGQIINIKNKPPKEPGLYIVRPLPGDEYYVSEFLRNCWAQENIGLYIDEGYMLPKNDRWFRACLTQGRSKSIEIIICSQRPVFLDKFVFTESSYFAVFNMNYDEDRKTVAAYLNGQRPKVLPDYHSLWYDVGRQRSDLLAPVPDTDAIIRAFEKRLEKKSVRI